MLNRVEELSQEVTAFNASSLDELEQFRIKMLSKKGEITSLAGMIREVAA
ncbi:MAG: phenylalanyl-tRNA synthetase alpha chain, partial [Parvicella sp.]